MNKKTFNIETEIVFSEEFCGFTAIPNTILDDERIDLETLGIYMTMCALRDRGEKTFTAKRLFKNTETLEVIEQSLKVLHEIGYVKEVKAGEYIVK